MSVSIRPGKVTCAGLVGIMMVLPNSIWKGSDARLQPVNVTVAPRRHQVREQPRHDDQARRRHVGEHGGD